MITSKIQGSVSSDRRGSVSGGQVGSVSGGQVGSIWTEFPVHCLNEQSNDQWKWPD